MKSFRLKIAAATLLPLSLMAAPAVAGTQSAHALSAPYAPITLAEVEAAQQAWGQALVAISTEYDRKGYAAAKRLAETVLDTAYGYNMGPVLFKPTLTVAPQTFRTQRDGALAYFVGGDKNFPKDTGFALKGWRSYKIENASVLITGNSATSMGNVMLTRMVVRKRRPSLSSPDFPLRIYDDEKAQPPFCGLLCCRNVHGFPCLCR